MANSQQVTLENVRIIFPNFGGRISDHNKIGSREFSVQLDPELGKELARQGWNVKFPSEDKPNNNVSLQFNHGLKLSWLTTAKVLLYNQMTWNNSLCLTM